MAGSREILYRMNSIRDTMKITNAMYMISSSKLKKANAALNNSRPHFRAIEEDIARLQRHLPVVHNIYFKERYEVKKNPVVAYLVVTADKGLAGAYNQNVIKKLKEELEHRPNIVPRIFVIGEIGREIIEKQKIPFEEHFRYTAQNPSVHRARYITGVLVQEYLDEKIDEIVIIYSKMVNAIESNAFAIQLLPLKRPEDYDWDEDIEIRQSKDDFEYLPSPEDVLHSLIPNYLTGYIYGALMESYSCEQNARMIAMQSATDSAKDMISQLQIEYNRARQAAITQEISEVSGGAKSQKKNRSQND